MLKLSLTQVIALAEMVADDVGVPILNKSALRHTLTADPPIPLLIHSDKVQLWVDRYYIAYSNHEERFVHYVYIGTKHVQEELSCVISRLACSDKTIEQAFLTDIQRQLQYALPENKMDYVQQNYWNRLTCNGEMVI